MTGCNPTPLKALKNGPSVGLASGVSGFLETHLSLAIIPPAELCAELLSIFLIFDH